MKLHHYIFVVLLLAGSKISVSNYSAKPHLDRGPASVSPSSMAMADMAMSAGL